MSNWSIFYASRVGESYPDFCEFRYKPFLTEIMSGSPLLVCEEGCGIATITKILARHYNISLSAFDIDQDQLDLAKKNLESVRDWTRCPPRPESCVNLYLADILHYEHNMKFDVIFSHGVLEHFNDEDITRILDRQKKYAKKVVHYIPTIKWDTPDRSTGIGDERLMEIEYWKSKFNPNRVILWNEGRDAILIWE